jgi:glycosyltransferase involved in cell wall biosynthesis
MGRVLCEANAAGVPVVAARSGGIPSVITHGENGLLFAPDDSADFLAQVLAIHRHPEVAARLSRGGHEIARQRFDWAVIGAAHERTFAKALARI